MEAAGFLLAPVDKLPLIGMLIGGPLLIQASYPGSMVLQKQDLRFSCVAKDPPKNVGLSE